MSQQVFISYSHNDISVVQHLKRVLQQHQIDVWIDFQNIRAGEDWGESIQRGLDESSQMVLIVSPASMHSRRVRAEWRYFLFRGKRVIPLLLEGPDEILGYELLDLHYVDCTTRPFDACFAPNNDRAVPPCGPDTAPRLCRGRLSTRRGDECRTHDPTSLSSSQINLCAHRANDRTCKSGTLGQRHIRKPCA